MWVRICVYVCMSHLTCAFQPQKLLLTVSVLVSHSHSDYSHVKFDLLLFLSNVCTFSLSVFLFAWWVIFERICDMFSHSVQKKQKIRTRCVVTARLIQTPYTRRSTRKYLHIFLESPFTRLSLDFWSHTLDPFVGPGLWVLSRMNMHFSFHIVMPSPYK